MKIRQVSGCAVYRRDQDHWKVLLVTSSSGKDWVIPKGGVEPNMTPEASAIKETREEGGVSCFIEHDLGMYRYAKRGELQIARIYGAQFLDYVHWEEEGLRNRCWFHIDDAIHKVERHISPFLMDLKSLLAVEA